MLLAFSLQHDASESYQKLSQKFGGLFLNFGKGFGLSMLSVEGLNGKSRVALVQSFFNLPLFRLVSKRVNQISALFWPTCFRGGGLVVASRALPGTLRVTGPAAKPSHKLVWGYTNRLWHLPSEGLFCCRSSSKMSLASTKSNVIGIISVRSSMSGSKSNDRTQSSLRLAYFRAEAQALLFGLCDSA